MSQRYQGGILGVGFNPLQAPDAPTIGTATAGNQNVSVAFTAPANVGGSAISSYRVLANPGGIGATTSSSPATVSGLTNGTTYTFSLAAVNSYGFSPYSGTATATPSLFVEEVFSTSLYTGNGSTQTITNGIDLSGQGGMVWCKARSAPSSFQDHVITDTARGATNALIPNGTFANNTGGYISALNQFNSNGFSLNGTPTAPSSSFPGTWSNQSGQSYASWTFREAPNFFDVVTYTGNGANRNIAHNLGSVPGMIIVKRTDTTGDWQVYHRSNANTQYQVLNTTAGVATGTTRWNSTTPTATEFTVGTDAALNASGGTYVAYLYAHDTASTGFIQCGTYTGNGSATGPVVTLGWEPQWVMIKAASSGPFGGEGNWQMYDNMRGWADGGVDAILYANLSNAEDATNSGLIAPTATGFKLMANYTANQSGTNYIYMAIRRGPMKTPTLGTSVFTPILRTGTSSAATITTSFAPDFVLTKATTGTYETYWWNAVDRLRAPLQGLFTNTTYAETAVANGLTTLSSGSFSVGTDFNYNNSSTTYINYTFGRAPSFFDEVCYTGTGVARTLNHNLGVVPELMIVKARSAATEGEVYVAPLGNDAALNLFADTPSSGAAFATGGIAWNNTTPTTSVFSLGNWTKVNGSGVTFVAYLFASCPGVSKVGSYTGTGALQTINCAFTTGARFVLIKRTDSTGDWYVWDSARGISSGSDPYSVLNSAAGQVAGTNYVDTTATGFQVTAAAPAAINANGGTYIFLAIS